MKKNKLNFLTVLTLSLIASVGWSQTTFNYTGAAETYTVPANTSSIQIEVSGGSGGDGNGGTGGLGATMIGTFSVSPGDVLDIAVGGEGLQWGNSGGGGGGTGVIFNGNPMIIAGGGGGGAINGSGYGGLVTPDGGNTSGLGGIAGNGGGKGFKTGDCGWAGGGGGFLTDGFGKLVGPNDGGNPGVQGGPGAGISWANGGAGGFSGGCNFPNNYGAWGCGGGGAGQYGGAGGGGYSGGGGGQYVDIAGVINYGGGGGGSINNGTDQTNTADNHAGEGIIIITVLCNNSVSSFSVDACDSYTVPSGDETYAISGTYSDTILNATGCDSIMDINVTITSVDVTTTLAGVTISANLNGGTYQWYDCSSGLNIPNETSQSFTALSDGYYAVIVTDGGCSDTSECVTIAGVGLEEIDNTINFYPNPTNGQITFETSSTIDLIEVYSISGQKLIAFTNSNLIDISELAEGVYIVKVFTENNTLIKQIVKE